jgi:hypothetical protein
MIRPEYVRLEPHGTEGENHMPGMVERSSTSASTRTCACGWPRAPSCAPTCPTTVRAPGTSRATPSPPTCARHLRVLEDDAARDAAAEDGAPAPEPASAA